MLRKLCGTQRNALALFILVTAFILCGCCTPAQPAADSNPELLAQLDAAIDRAADYLESQQDQRGAYPSQTYGLMRDGVALTPHVLRSLAATDRNNETMKQGFAFLAEQVNWTRSIPSRPSLNSAVHGPVYFIADTQLAANRCPQQAHAKLKKINVGLPRLQIRDDDATPFAQQGGWGYSTTPFAGVPKDFDRLQHAFDHGQAPAPIVPYLSANISATVYALDAIPPPAAYFTGHGEIPPQYTSMTNAALRFAARCQNFNTGDPTFDDGGFFFNPADPARNKGGPAGTDAQGYARFHASGSSTADGLRVLLRCHLPRDDPRVAAASDWLFKHFDPAHNPGTFNPDREILRDAYYFYYAASVADTFTLLGQGPTDWPGDLARVLLDKQQPDGSFANPYTDGKEDDPLVATAFALRAMIACRAAIIR